jgi:hypothetical protein
MEDNGYPEGRTVQIGRGETLVPKSDEELIAKLQESIEYENATRRIRAKSIDDSIETDQSEKRKYHRPSWKTEYENMHTKAMSYRVWAICGWSFSLLIVIVELIIKGFS